MRRALIAFVAIAIMATVAVATDNPFFSEYDTPYQVPPFDKITVAHYAPAFDEGIKRQKAEIEAIANNTEPATFANTIEAIELAGPLLTKVIDVFFNLHSADTNDEMQEIAKDVSPKLSALTDDMYLNPTLFARVKALYDTRDDLELSGEQNRLLGQYYRSFIRGGANLNDDDKATLRELNERLAVLQLKFGENVLEENNTFEMVLDNEADLAGLPDNVIEAAAETAVEREHEGKWVFTLHKPSMIPFITYSDRRDLREKIYRGYFMRGDNGNDLDNKDTVQELASLRAERAKILGYKTHADFVLDEAMAKTPDRVYELLDRLWSPALRRATEERDVMQAMIDAEGGDFKLDSWDWWYYAEKVKKAKYEFDDEVLRPYFQLENVRKGAFEVATRLFGITFEERTDIPVYHEDVRVFEVKDEDGSHLGIYYVDYHPRASKRGGAWMNAYRSQSRIGGNEVTPIICNVSNVSKPTADEPALLSLDEVATLFHEFGHALHGLLSDCTYPSLSGTNVARDFVEMPSQVFENWALEPEVLALYARHYETGELIPEELVAKMKNAKLFNQGFATTEYLAASYLDMDWHTIPDAKKREVLKFEDRCLERIGLIPEIKSRYRSAYFRHIFSGGYSAGYYSYIWAEVVDADAFQAFKEAGLFDKETAARFRKFILASGDTDDPMELYKKFRGREPEIEPLLERRGLN
ncbi:MAG: M3 family metallopeptidase [Candidatus Krumholzibacteriota bacterium]|nr:M3 family metallopeptidase [Candidatus Krumholzibacteriota bacterium]